jgi:uncharacterized protein YbaR (Trm112 family)
LKLVGRFSLKAPDVSDLLEETQRFREHLALLACPSCSEKALKLVNYIQGPTGWASGFFCTNCSTKGELNSDGFRVELTEAKKEPQEEEPKPKLRKEIKK